MAISINTLVLPEDRILFGCTLKNLAIDLDFKNNNSFTATIVKEPGQTFELANVDFQDGPSTLVGFTINNTNLIGVVSSYEEVITDINGTGIFNIIMGVGDFPLGQLLITAYAGAEEAIYDSHVILGVETLEENTSGINITRLIDILESNTFLINRIPIKFNFDFVKSELNNLDDYKLSARFDSSLFILLTDLMIHYGYEYFLNFSFDNDILIVDIKLTQSTEFTSDLDNIQSVVDFILDRQSDKIISSTQGFENNAIAAQQTRFGDIFTYTGAPKKELKLFGNLSPFWGFDNNNNLLDQPSVVLEGDNQNQFYHPSISDLKDFINGRIVVGHNGFSQEKVDGITKIVKISWGKQFVIDNNNIQYSSLIDINNNIIVDSIALGWWEENTEIPLLHIDAGRNLLQSEDGRWNSFIKLKNPEGVFDNTIKTSRNIVYDGTNYYMLVDLTIINNYLIVTLPLSLNFIDINENNDRMIEIDSAYLALYNKLRTYGPFHIWKGERIKSSREYTFQDLISDPTLQFAYETVQKIIGVKEVTIPSDSLVPWDFSDRDTTNEEAINKLVDSLKTDDPVHISPPLPFSSKFGKIQVADLPLKEILERQNFPDGKAVTHLNISFGIDGIKTLYQIEPFVNNGSLANRVNRLERFTGENSGRSAANPAPGWSCEKIAAAEGKDPKKECGIDPKFNPIEKIIKEAIDPLKKQIQDIVNQLPSQNNAPSDDIKEFVYQKPEGGLGVIESIDTGGPFYNIRRLNYADIDPQTFAGGLNITTSYFLTEWKHARNLAEPDDSPGYLLVGTRVTVSIFSDSEFGPFIPYIEQTPTIFAPPKPSN